MKDQPDNEARLVQYLLGNLSEAEQVEIEDRAFADPDFSRAIVAVEAELIDAYAHDQLSDAERAQFNQRFLASAERRRKVEFARAFARVAPEFAGRAESDLKPSPAISVGFRTSIAEFIKTMSPVARYAIAAAALLILVGASLATVEALRLRRQLQAEVQLRQHQQEELQRQIEDARSRSEVLSGELEREKERQKLNEQLIGELERESVKQAPEPTIASLILLSGLPRGSVSRPKLVLKQSMKVVRLQVEIDPSDEFSIFRIEIRNAAGQEVWSRSDLSSRKAKGGREIVISLPAKVFKAEEYELSLKGGNSASQTQTLGYYYFVVLNK